MFTLTFSSRRHALGLLAVLAGIWALVGAASYYEIGDGTVTTAKVADASITEAKLDPAVVAQLGGGGPATGFGADDDFIADTLYVWVPLRAWSGAITAYGSSQFESITLTDESSAYRYTTITLPEGAVGPRTNGLVATVYCSRGASESGEMRLDVALLGRGENEFLGTGDYTSKNVAVNVGTVNSRVYATAVDFSADNVLSSGDFQIHARVTEATDAATSDTWLVGFSLKIY